MTAFQAVSLSSILSRHSRAWGLVLPWIGRLVLGFEFGAVAKRYRALFATRSPGFDTLLLQAFFIQLASI